MGNSIGFARNFVSVQGSGFKGSGFRDCRLIFDVFFSFGVERWAFDVTHSGFRVQGSKVQGLKASAVDSLLTLFQ